MILITGATGTNGKEVVKQLSDRSVRIRVMIRPSEKKTRLPDTGVESVIADFDDVNSLEIALAAHVLGILKERGQASRRPFFWLRVP